MKSKSGVFLAAMLMAVVFFLCACGTENTVKTPDMPAAAELAAGTGTREELPEEPPEEAPEELSPPTLEELRETFRFQDVPEESPYRDAACYMAYRGIFSGEEGCFFPDDLVTRGETVTALFRESGDPAPVYTGTFSDVPADSPWAEGVSWGVGHGIALGSSSAAFHPEERVTRQQLALFLQRYAFDRGMDAAPRGDLSAYSDGEGLSQEAAAAMAWAAGQGLFAALVSDTLYPDLPVSRGQLAQVLTAFAALRGEEPAAQAELPAATVGRKSREQHEAIQLKIEEVAKKYGAMGLQVAVIEGGQVTDTYQYGWAVRDQAAMTEDAKLRVASLSKVVVGMGAMALQEEGVVDITESVGECWGLAMGNPYYPDKPVTLQSILSHTSSILIDDGASLARDVIVKRLTGSGYSNLVPGSIHSYGYNNYAFGILGSSLEVAAEETLDSVLHRRFLDLMGIDASFASGTLRDTGTLAVLYRQDGSVGRSLETACNQLIGAPGDNGRYFAGGFTCSAKDYAKMLAVLANDGRYQGLRLLSGESVETMESLQGTPYGASFQQALPMKYREDMYGRTGLFYHTGSAYGVYNLASYDPETGDGVVVLTTGANPVGDEWGVYAVGGRISQYIYDAIA